jgi:outer membrane protein assembly factor BamE (lipoprotein component of BamABCDE complex)
MSLRNTFMAATFALALSGCAGTRFSWDAARQIRAGMSTAQVKELMGTPNNVRSTSEALIYVWVYVNTLASTTRTLRVDFRDDKVIQAPVIPDEF